MSPPGRDSRSTDAQIDADDRLEENDGFLGSSLEYRPYPLAPSRSPSAGAPLYVPFSLARPPARHSRSRRRGTSGAAPPPPAVPSPFARPSQWDTITLAGVLFLGLASVKGATANAVSVKKHKGRDGGRVTDGGAVAAELSVTFRMWDAETWASWDQVFALIDPQRTPDRRAPVDVSHPALAQRNIRRVYVKEVSIPERQSDGEWHVTAKVIQWLPSMKDRRGGSVTRTRTAPNSSSTTTTPTADRVRQAVGVPGIAGGEQFEEGVDDPAETDSAP